MHHAPIVDEDVEAGMGFDRGLRELGDLAGLADIDAVDADLLRPGAANLGGHTRQPGFVAIGEGEIAAARGKLDRQRPADAAGGAGHGCGGSTNRGHVRLAPTWGRFRVANPIRLAGFGNRARAIGLILRAAHFARRLEGWPDRGLMVRDARSRAPHHEERTITSPRTSARSPLPRAPVP